VPALPYHHNERDTQTVHRFLPSYTHIWNALVLAFLVWRHIGWSWAATRHHWTTRVDADDYVALGTASPAFVFAPVWYYATVRSAASPATIDSLARGRSVRKSLPDRTV
jgi:hypothetical protein